MKATVTKEDFQAWLESKKPSTIVGRASEAEACPLAKYFQEINNIKQGCVTVNNKFITVVEKETSAKITPWMNKFIEKVDSWHEDETNKNGFSLISAKKALDILVSC